MSQTASLPATTQELRARDAREAVGEPQPPKQLDALHTVHGDTTIADTVVQKLAGIAAREVPGVYSMGNAARRAFNQLTERIPGSQTNVGGGVSVEKGERQTAIEVSIVVEYGVAIADVSERIRQNIISAVEHGTGLEVLEVNVNVTDVHLPEDDDDPATTSGSSDSKLQ
ncbi:Uncharacterized conserved protein YloU, alkaline shock protein (Asp23) family [Friedmanniella luteola]|uniref:Uncharacterized conserved protein YloU, alkaline shock protein (Asp23) family n=1 Tax=Friedmanniella luteola TaxID=546871 RepID=A0A1H1W6L2_9ACTN|nr:Uncharacterized conserved protein YloU, alkaline shock protein (Asp23) family [Friedmanniella luteola]